MRRTAIAALLVGGLLVTACGDDDEETADTPADSAGPVETAAPGDTSPPDEGGGDCADGKTLTPDVLTIATGEPAFEPWVVGDAPESGEGFEAAVAYAVAREMGFTEDQVTWVRTTFDEAIQPGAKNFDFNLQQYSITAERAANISFSEPYYSSNQAIVALAGSPAEGAASLADLKDVKFGAQAGTTSLGFITDVIQPDAEPFVYDDNVGAKAALEADQIDAIVVDLPTALFISAVEIEGSSVVGQFPAAAGGTTDDFGLVFELDNPLVECANAALTTLRDTGELQEITDEWLVTADVAPVIEVG
ncbi:MAG TPA: ABC transporter substrate-binding protein [Ilumatobacteraceae bacterium]|nr:ABC transporter substrate-binding protein [Ilumatobacteraceae bacterium]